MNATLDKSLLPVISRVRTFNKDIDSTLVRLRKFLPVINNFIGTFNTTVDLLVLQYVPNIKYALQDLNSSIAEAKCIFDIS